MGGRRNRARDRLPVDVTEVGKGEAARGQLLVELLQRDAAFDRDGARLGVECHDAVQPVQPEEAAVRARDVGERVPGADDLDGLTGAPRSAHSLGDLELALGLLDRRRRTRLVGPSFASGSGRASG